MCKQFNAALGADAFLHDEGEIKSLLERINHNPADKSILNWNHLKGMNDISQSPKRILKLAYEVAFGWNYFGRSDRQKQREQVLSLVGLVIPIKVTSDGYDANTLGRLVLSPFLGIAALAIAYQKMLISNLFTRLLLCHYQAGCRTCINAKKREIVIRKLTGVLFTRGNRSLTHSSRRMCMRMSIARWSLK